jgi:hypothetical protein
MMMVAMRSTVGPGHLDSIAFDLVDGADVDAVGTDDFHLFPDLAEVGHVHHSLLFVIAGTDNLPA